LKKTIDNGDPLDIEVANIVANAMKDWAIANGTPDGLKMMVGADTSMEDTFISLIKSYDAQSKKQ
jgi:glutamine synthetase